MAVELVKEKYNNAINIVEIGGPQSGSTVKIGGETMLPFLFEEGQMPNAPITAIEVMDCEPVEWPQPLKDAFGADIKDPVRWAKTAVEKFGAKLLCVRLQSVHPDWGNKSSDHSVSILKQIAKEVKVPLIVVGSGDDDKDNDLLPKASNALKGTNSLFGVASQENYKTLTATCLADGHSLIAESPIDINIAKQVNILVSDMGFDPKKIVMHPTTTSLGYGMEYVYSIMERARLAAFIGDKMLSMPFILFAGQEVWKVKEAKDSMVQGVNWEIATSISMLQAGADILVVRHPDSSREITGYVETMMKR
ncbi:MAG: acetyl-CoA decarbonylase/synthase complex subunit delta [Candidatus Omnitrophota bacterium]|nr:acetyl-CoA decarbonylase/synthase complex subunit delta [Candidatus Omnitrophota bacterium]